MRKNKNEVRDEKDILGFKYCNVSIATERAVKSPIFFIENGGDKDKNVFVTGIPTPHDVALECYNDFKFVKESLCKENITTAPKVFISILVDRFLSIIEANTFGIFYNGLYNIMAPFITVPIRQLTERFYVIRSKDTIEAIKSLLVNSGLTVPEFLSMLKVLIASDIADTYFYMVNRLLLEGEIELKGITKYLADIQDLDYNKIDDKQKYMFVEGCLLEVAKEDVAKIMEVVEVNALNMKFEYVSEGLELEDKSDQ